MNTMSISRDVDPYENLANAIVLQAVQDYRTARRDLARNRDSEWAQRAIDDGLEFFRSGWFATLTSLDPEFLIRELDLEAAK